MARKRHKTRLELVLQPIGSPLPITFTNQTVSFLCEGCSL